MTSLRMTGLWSPRAVRIGPEGEVAALMPVRRLYGPYEWYDRWLLVGSEGQAAFAPVAEEDVAGWREVWTEDADA